MGGGGRALPAGLIGAGLLLLGTRLFTGIVTLPDDPTSFLVVKRRPSMELMIRAGDGPLRRDYILLDDDENQLVYEPAYLAVASAAPMAAACLVSAGAAVAWTRRRHRVPPS